MILKNHSIEKKSIYDERLLKAAIAILEEWFQLQRSYILYLKLQAE